MSRQDAMARLKKVEHELNRNGFGDLVAILRALVKEVFHFRDEDEAPPSDG